MNLPNSQRDSPLYVACDKGMEDMVALLLKQPDTRLDAGRRHLPLHAAAARGFFFIAEKLLQAGAQVNKVRIREGGWRWGCTLAPKVNKVRDKA